MMDSPTPKQAIALNNPSYVLAAFTDVIFCKRHANIDKLDDEVYFKKIKCNNQSGDQGNCTQQLSSSELSTSMQQYKISWKTAIDVACKPITPKATNNGDSNKEETNKTT
jgi:hypothetical protein